MAVSAGPHGWGGRGVAVALLCRVMRGRVLRSALGGCGGAADAAPRRGSTPVVHVAEGGNLILGCGDRLLLVGLVQAHATKTLSFTTRTSLQLHYYRGLIRFFFLKHELVRGIFFQLQTLPTANFSESGKILLWKFANLTWAEERERRWEERRDLTAAPRDGARQRAEGRSLIPAAGSREPGCRHFQCQREPPSPAAARHGVPQRMPHRSRVCKEQSPAPIPSSLHFAPRTKHRGTG